MAEEQCAPAGKTDWPEKRIFVLVLAHFAACFCLIAIPGLFVPAVGIWFGLKAAEIDAQLFLALIWACWGASSAKWRLAGVAISLLVVLGYIHSISCFFNGVFPRSALEDFMIWAYCWILPAGATALLMLGQRFVAHRRGGVEKEASGAHPWQFSIRQLFALMTSAAVLLAISRIMPSRQSMFDLFNVYSLVQNIVIWSTVSFCMLWAALGEGKPFLRVLPAFSMVAVAAAAMTGFFRFKQPLELTEIIYAFTQAIIVFVSLLIVRSCGYRWSGGAIVKLSTPLGATGEPKAASAGWLQKRSGW